MEKNNDLTQINDQKEILNLIDEGSKISAQASIWIENKGSSFKLIMNCLKKEESFHPTKIATTIPDKFDLIKLRQELKAHNSFTCSFNFSTSRAIVFFSTEIIDISEKEINFLIPKEIYKAQRRNAIRLTLRSQAPINAEIQIENSSSSALILPIENISTSGLAFLNTGISSELFKKDTLIKKLDFSIKNRKFSLECKVMHVGPYGKTTPQQTKIGVVFLNINVSVEAFIASFVFDEMRKYAFHKGLL